MLGRKIDKDNVAGGYFPELAAVHLSSKLQMLMLQDLHQIKSEYHTDQPQPSRSFLQRLFRKPEKENERPILKRNFIDLPGFPPEKLNALIDYLIAEFRENDNYQEQALIHELQHYIDYERRDAALAQSLSNCFRLLQENNTLDKLLILDSQNYDALLKFSTNISCLEEAEAILHEILFTRVISLPRSFSIRNMAGRLAGLLQELVTVNRHSQLSKVETALNWLLERGYAFDPGSIHNLAVLILLLPERMLSNTPGELLSPSLIPKTDRDTDHTQAFHAFSQKVVERIVGILDSPQTYAESLVNSDIKSRFVVKLRTERLVAANQLLTFHSEHPEFFSPAFEISTLADAEQDLKKSPEVL